VQDEIIEVREESGPAR